MKIKDLHKRFSLFQRSLTTRFVMISIAVLTMTPSSLLASTLLSQPLTNVVKGYEMIVIASIHQKNERPEKIGWLFNGGVSVDYKINVAYIFKGDAVKLSESLLVSSWEDNTDRPTHGFPVDPERLVLMGLKKDEQGTWRIWKDGYTQGPLTRTLSGPDDPILTKIQLALSGQDPDLDNPVHRETMEYVSTHYPQYADGSNWTSEKLGLVWNPKADLPLTIASVKPSSPASMGTFLKKDAVLSVESHSVKTVEEFEDVVNGYAAGSMLKITIQRNGQSQKLFLRLATYLAPDKNDRQEAPAKSKPR